MFQGNEERTVDEMDCPLCHSQEAVRSKPLKGKVAL